MKRGGKVYEKGQRRKETEKKRSRKTKRKRMRMRRKLKHSHLDVKVWAIQCMLSKGKVIDHR